jgi:tRNA uridine 5-carbamoylmethylation protein Kti12
MKDTTIINFFGGPASGKSTMACGLFYFMKVRNIDCELLSEYAKEMTWEERHKALHNQIYITANQHHRLFRLIGKVEYIISDSALPLGIIYDNEDRHYLHDLIMNEFNKMKNTNIFIERPSKEHFRENGRNQDYAESVMIDDKIRCMLDKYEIPHYVLHQNDDLNDVIDKIINKRI